MAYGEHVPNRVINPATGFSESNGYMSAFDSERKLAFLKNYRSNGLRLRRACREMGLSEDTVSRHLRSDEKFRKEFDSVQADYLEELEAVSKENALNPRSVIERIFQLKCHMPERYGQENRPISTVINIALDGKSFELLRGRDQVIDAQLIEKTSGELQPGDTAPDAPTAPLELPVNHA